jgi:hypothetical protein
LVDAGLPALRKGVVTLAEKTICEAWAPPSDEPAWQWVEGNVELGNDSEIKGRVSFEWVPMSRFFLDKCQDPKVKRISAMVSAQSAKTKTVEFYLMWSVKNRPVETIWYQDDNVAAKTFFKTRLYPDLEDCEAIRALLPTRRDKTNQTLIQFDTMNLYVLGANKKSNRERITAATVLCDEIRNYPPGAMQGIRNRYKTIKNYKEIIFSTAGVEGDELHTSFEDGTRHLFFWACPKCGHLQTFRFGKRATILYPKAREIGGMIWDENPITRPSEGVWNFEEVAKTVHYECENPTCKQCFKNSDKLSLIKTIQPTQTNPMALSENVSMHWNEMYMPWPQCDWDKIVIKFLKSKVAANRGDKEPLKVIVQESFGEPWVDEDHVAREIPITDFTPSTDGKKHWDQQDFLFMAVDVQRKGKFWATVSAWSKTGLNLFLWAGELRGWSEVESKEREYGVRKRHVFVDCGDRDQEVFSECVKRGEMVNGQWETWTAMRGENRDGYDYIPTSGPNRGKKFRLPFKWPLPSGNPSFGLHRDNPELPILAGKSCPIVYWSNYWIKGIVLSRRDQMERGKLAFIGPNVCREFQQHLYAEHLQLEKDRNGRDEWRYVQIGNRPNHLLDCVCMDTVAACMAKIIGDGVPE